MSEQPNEEQSTRSSHEPGVPRAGRRPELVLAGLLMLVAAGALVLVKLGRAPEERAVPSPTLDAGITEPASELRRPPPPPPPAPAPEAPSSEPGAGPRSGNATAETAGRNPGAGAVRPGDPCAAPCTGSVEPALEKALQARGAQARSCYNLALEHQPELAGRLVLSVRVGENGETCRAAIAENDLESPEVEACVLQRFRNGQFPPPKGGCADTRVPLNFKQRNPRAP